MSKSTPRYGHAPIVMEKVSGHPFTAAGQFCWELDGQRRRSLVVALPLSQDGRRFSACEFTIDHKNHCDAQWSWNGNKSRPTLKPSIHWSGAWHGWVTDGVLREA